MALKNLLLGPLYLGVVLFIAAQVKNRLVKNEVEEHYYYKVLFAKLFGVTFFAFIYHFYYGTGDTVAFHHWSSKFFTYLFTDFRNAISFLFTDSEEAFYTFKYSNFEKYGYILKYGSRETAFIKITALVNILGLDSFMSTSYLFAFASFISNWLLYKVFSNYFPQLKKQLIWGILLIPSVLFWGGGIMKDTISFCGICLLVYALYGIFFIKGKKLRNLLLIIFSTYLIIQMKAYVFLAFIPAASMWIFGELKDKIKQKAVRIVVTPLFYLGAIAMLFILINVLGDEFGRFSMSSIDQTIKDYQGWHSIASEGGAGYDLHVADASFSSMIAAFPKAVNVTLFRPYLWEVSSPVVFMAAIESLLFFIFFSLILVKTKVIGLIRQVFSMPILQMSFIYAVFLAFAVGFTSYNFGALVRYKIPLMPFFTSFLIVAWYGAFKKNKKNQ